MTKAQKAEAANEAFTFEFEGEHYTVDPDNMNNLELLEAVEDEKYITAMRGFVGVDQYNKFKDSVRTDGRVPVEKFEAFLNLLFAEMGAKNS